MARVMMGHGLQNGNSMLAALYRLLTAIGAPGISLYLFKRRLDGREDQVRYRERMGFASLPRPENSRIIWCHAASVGEAASLLTLIEKIRETYSDSYIVITTGTVTSAHMLEKRLPSGAVHQYVPVDRVAYVKRFLNHWKPDLALWVESELWPNTLSLLKKYGIPTVLLNGRISRKSFRNWSYARGWIREMLSTFDLCLVQTEEARGRYMVLGAQDVRCISNLKYAAKPLPADLMVVTHMQLAMSGRNVWGMVSTHRGEEDLAIAAHKYLKEKEPRILTVLVPRHPARGDEVASRISAAGLTYVRRSSGETLASTTDIYLVDTIGELGLFFRVCPVVVMGGSFVPVGGHNPIEPAQLGVAIIFGPSMFNFSSIAKEFVARKAAVQVRHTHELNGALEKWLLNPGARFSYVRAAQSLADQKRQVLEEVMNALKHWLKSDPTDRSTLS